MWLTWITPQTQRRKIVAERTDVLAQMSLPVRAIQTDGDSEFMGALGDACQDTDNEPLILLLC